MVHAWRSEDNLRGSVPSHHRDPTRVIWLGGKCLYPLNHLPNPLESSLFSTLNFTLG